MLVDRDFVLVLGEWSPDYASSLLTRSVARSVIVRWGAAPRHYTALPCQAALKRLAKAKTTNVVDALALTEHDTLPIVEPLAAPPNGAKNAIMVDAFGVQGIVGDAIDGNARHLKGLRRKARSKGILSGDLHQVIGPNKPASAPVTRQLVAELPTTAVLGEEVALLISLSAVEFAVASALPISIPIGAKIVVVAKPQGGLALVDANQQTLLVTDPPNELPVCIVLRAVAAGLGSVRVFGFHEGVALGSLTLTLTIAAAANHEARASSRERRGIELSPRVAPDLSLFVFNRSEELHFFLHSADGRFLMKPFGPTRLRASPAHYFRSFFDGIERIPCETPEDRSTACRQLEMRGADLYDKLFPDDLKAVLWTLQDRIDTIQVLSDEPWIPWELCHVTRKQQSRAAPGFFLAERFSITRWMSGTPAKTSISLRDLAIVVPNDAELEEAHAERDFLLGLAGEQRQVTQLPATFIGVTDAMAQGRFDAWHFSGHAGAGSSEAPDEGYFELENQMRLTPEMVSGRFENVRIPKPFVFINACQSARSSLSLTSLGGWATRFLGDEDEGASAFIGSYWEVFDDAALAFSKEVYRLLLSGTPIGAAVRAARKSIRASDELTWLAYTVYADPHATVVGCKTP